MLKFLIIEDDDGVRALLKSLLKKQFTCAILEAENGQIGLQILQEHIPDIVLLDISMPVMDGIETLKGIRSNPIFKSIPVMMITAINEKDTISALAEFGISDYILKPIDTRITIKRILRITEKLERNKNGAFSKGETAKSKTTTDELLLIDKDPISKKNITSALYNKFIIHEASSGTEGFNIFTTYHPRYILISDNLGLLDKKIITQKIREIANEEEVSIFLLVDNIKAFSSKVFNYDGILKKSSSPEEFLKEFNKIVIHEIDPIEKLTETFLKELPKIQQGLYQLFWEFADEKISVINEPEPSTGKEFFYSGTKFFEPVHKVFMDFGLTGSEENIVALTNKIAVKQNKSGRAANDLFKELTEVFVDKNSALFEQSGFKLEKKSKVEINTLTEDNVRNKLTLKTENCGIFIAAFSFTKQADG